MRIAELVDRHDEGTLRVLQLGGPDDLTRHLRPSSGVEVVRGEPSDERAGDLAVVVLRSEPDDEPFDDVDTLADRLDTLVEGASMLVLLTGLLEKMPVGPVVSLVTRAGLQVVEASPLEHPYVTGGLMLRRGSKLLPVAPYLSDRPAGGLEDATLLRMVNEHLVENLSVRAREGMTRELRAQLAATRAELAEERARRKALESSRSVQLGLALGRLPRHPVRGLGEVPRALRKKPAAGSPPVGSEGSPPAAP